MLTLLRHEFPANREKYREFLCFEAKITARLLLLDSFIGSYWQKGL
jgi:hypothetical protein